jgi:hypothetical protein
LTKLPLMKTSTVGSDAVMACASMIVGIIGALPLEQRVHDAPQLVGHLRGRDQAAIESVPRLDCGQRRPAKQGRLTAQPQEVHDASGV